VLRRELALDPGLGGVPAPVYLQALSLDSSGETIHSVVYVLRFPGS